MKDVKILVIHPEGNINNNPNLSGIVEILCENNYSVDILSPKLNIPQIAPCDGSKFILFNRKLKKIEQKFSGLIQYNPLFVQLKRSHFKGRYNLIIGVDRDGIIEASYLSRLLNVPYGLISYEIFFESETSKKYKEIEIEACEKIEFAVCQDNLRSSLLAQENRIDLNKIINIPVSGRGIKKREKTKNLHVKLKIPLEKKIALFAGSIAKWSMIEKLIQSVNDWPKDWVLVLHNRYGLTPQIKELLKKMHSDSIFISQEIYPTPEDFSEILFSVDLGIALYKPVYSGRYDGNNLKYLGLASGKISTYLQHGIPVLTNENGLISDLIREFGAGCVIRDTKDIPKVIAKINQEYSDECYSLFNEYLDLDIHVDPLLNKIKSIV